METGAIGISSKAWKKDWKNLKTMGEIETILLTTLLKSARTLRRVQMN